MKITENKAECPMCDSEAIIELQSYTMDYGHKDPVEIPVKDIPIIRCDKCHERFMGRDAMSIEHAAVCHHFGMLSPEEVREIQGTRSTLEFSNDIDITEKELKRILRGAVIQDPYIDRRIRSVAGEGKYALQK